MEINQCKLGGNFTVKVTRQRFYKGRGLRRLEFWRPCHYYPRLFLRATEWEPTPPILGSRAPDTVQYFFRLDWLTTNDTWRSLSLWLIETYVILSQDIRPRAHMDMHPTGRWLASCSLSKLIAEMTVSFKHSCRKPSMSLTKYHLLPLLPFHTSVFSAPV